MSKAKRTALGPKKRFAIFHRDGFTCQYCGRKPPEVTLVVDHVIAVANGGTNDPTNLISSCYDCNSGKGATDLNATPESVSSRVEREKEQRAQVEALNHLISEQRNYRRGAASFIGNCWYNKICPENESGKWTFNDERHASVVQFLEVLCYQELLDALDLAFIRVPATFANDTGTWKYFCGICWRKIKGDKR